MASAAPCTGVQPASEDLQNHRDEGYVSDVLLDGGYWKLRHPVMQKCAPAAVLLAVMADHAGAGGECFASVETLMKETGCRRRTVGRQIKWLLHNKWIEETGATKGKGVKVYRLTADAENVARKRSDYGILPKWFAKIRLPDKNGIRKYKPGHAVTFVYAYVLNRLRMIEKLEAGGNGCLDDRRYIEVSEVMEATGLTRNGVRSAWRWLAERGLIEPELSPWEGGEFVGPGPVVPPRPR